jgi:phage shock protein B
MDPIGFLTMLMVGVVAVIAVSGGILVAIIKAFRGGSKSPATSNQESKLIQEIHHGLTRMDERIEVLETLLLKQGEQPKSDSAAHREER